MLKVKRAPYITSVKCSSVWRRGISILRNVFGTNTRSLKIAPLSLASPHEADLQSRPSQYILNQLTLNGRRWNGWSYSNIMTLSMFPICNKGQALFSFLAARPVLDDCCPLTSWTKRSWLYNLKRMRCIWWWFEKPNQWDKKIRKVIWLE